MEEKTYRTEGCIGSTRPPPSGFLFCICYSFLKSDISELYYQVPAVEVNIIQDLKQNLQKPCCTSASREVYYQTLIEQIFLAVCTEEQQTHITYTCYRTERRLRLSVSLSIQLVWPGLACLCSLHPFNEDFKCISV